MAEILRERANTGLHSFVFNWMEKQAVFGQEDQLLDIGCGSGAWLSRFQRNGLRSLVGIDLDTEQFSLSDVRAYPVNIDKYDGSVWGSFTLITALELIEHLENLGLFFYLAQQNLVGGGSLIISTPNIHALPARIRFLLKGRLPHFDDKSDPTHIYPVYIENLLRVADRYGFVLITKTQFPEKGSNIYTGVIKSMASVLSLFVPNNMGGDNIILHLKKTGGRS